MGYVDQELRIYTEIRVKMMRLIILGLCILGGCHAAIDHSWEAFSDQPAARTPILRKPGPNGHVVFLVGIINGKYRSEHTPRELKAELEKSGITSQIWPWQKIYGENSTKVNLLTSVEEVDSKSGEPASDNVWRARSFAERLKEWRLDLKEEDRDPVPIYLVAGSGGGWIARLVCSSRDDEGKEILEDKFFAKIILVSTVLDGYLPLGNMHDKVEHGIWNYASRRDYFVKSWETKYPSRVHHPAGYYGFDEEAVRELWYDDTTGPANGNHGGHTSCYAKEYAKKYLVPLLMQPSGTAPGWN